MMYDQEIYDEFVVEAGELLGVAEEDILELEVGSDKETVNRIFRAFHTVKGNAAMLGLDRFSALAHYAEDALTRVRSGTLDADKVLVDLMLKVLDALKHMLEDLRAGEPDTYDIAPLLLNLKQHLEDGGLSTAPPSEPPAPAAGIAITMPPPPDGADAPGLNILAAEDDLTSREIIKIMLAGYGRVTAVENGLDAVSKVKEAFEKVPPRPFDLICLDIMMPELDGMEAGKQIRALEKANGVPLHQEAAIIMTTALDDPKTVIRSLYKTGATAYLVKPVQKDSLEKELKKLALL